MASARPRQHRTPRQGFPPRAIVPYRGESHDKLRTILAAACEMTHSKTQTGARVFVKNMFILRDRGSRTLSRARNMTVTTVIDRTGETYKNNRRTTVVLEKARRNPAERQDGTACVALFECHVGKAVAWNWGRG